MTCPEITDLVIQMAKKNRGCGCRRIQGALANLGHILAHNTVGNILKRNGIEPAPERVRKTTWKEFFEPHWEQNVASEFFTIEVWTCRLGNESGMRTIGGLPRNLHSLSANLATDRCPTDEWDIRLRNPNGSS